MMIRVVLFSVIACLPVTAFGQPSRIERNVARSKATLADAVAERSWKDGEIVATQGRTTANDGGANAYRYRRTGRSGVTIDNIFFISAGGSDDYLEAIDKSQVRLSQAGGIPDNTTDSTSALQAAISACQAVGSKLVIDGKYRITDTVDLPIHQPMTVTGRTGDANTLSSITLDTATNDKAAFRFVSNAAAAADYWHIRDLHIITTGDGSNLSAFAFATDGNEGSFTRRGVKCRFERLEIACRGYAFNFTSMPYTVQPVWRDIDVTAGGAIRITANPLVGYAPHTNSGMIIDGFHFSANGAKVGASFHLEGCRKATLRGIISEGSPVFSASVLPYTGAAHLYVSDVYENIDINGLWMETNGTPQTGVVGVIVDNPVNTAGAGTCRIKNVKFDGRYRSISVTGYSAHCILEGGMVTTDGAPAISVDPGCQLVFDDYLFTSGRTMASIASTPNVEIRNPSTPSKYSAVNKSNTERYSWPDSDEIEPTVVYSYSGGYLSNNSQKLTAVGGYYPATGHKPQNDPVKGPTLLIEKAGSGPACLLWHSANDPTLGLDTTALAGRQLFYRAVVRLPHINLASQTFELQRSTGSSLEVAQTTFTNTNNWEWQTVLGSYILQDGDSFSRMMEIDCVSTDPEYVQIASLDIALDGLPPIRHRETMESFTGSITGGPGEGTYVVGDRLLEQNPTTTYGYVCSSSGTSRTITSVTGNTTSGSNQLTSIANITELIPGDFISLTGNSGTYRIVSIDDATTATLSSNATATVTGSAVSAVAPTWQEIPIGEVLRPDMQGYAQISVEDNATATTVASTQTDWSAKSQFTGFTANAAESNGATPDHTNDHITITDAGVWEVQAVLTLSGSVASDLWELAFFVDNGSLKLTPKQGVNIVSAGFTYSNQVTVSGLATFAENDTVELWVQRTNGTGTLTITNAVMTAKKVSD